MTHHIVRGKEMERLPEHSFILRAVKVNAESSDGSGESNINRYQFDSLFLLSDADKKETPPALSVYAEGLTMPRQVLELLVDSSRYGAVARLAVDEVRAIAIPPSIQQFVVALDVLWIKAQMPDGTDDVRPGADGHAGLTGLNRPKGAEKYAYKALQDALVVLVQQECRSLAEWETTVAEPPVEAGDSKDMPSTP